MLDIDFFKQYNDTYGHIAGDHTLKRVAKVIKTTFRRPSDFVFRLGGEEFGVLIIGVDEQNCELLAQKVVEMYAKRQLNMKLHKLIV
jgi:diguanylate cyclase (GGDEF)-like protein